MIVTYELIPTPQEKELLDYLINNGSATIYELKNQGIGDPCTVVSRLRKTGLINIKSVYTHTMLNGSIYFLLHYEVDENVFASGVIYER